MLRILIAAFAWLMVSPTQAAVVYTYQGNSFNNISDTDLIAESYSTLMNVLLSFEVDTALAPNLSDSNIAALVTDFTISDGRNTLTAANATDNILFRMWTDSSGAISMWGVSAGIGDLSLPDPVTLLISTLSFPGTVIDGGLIRVCSGDCFPLATDRGNISYSPGNWTASVTPVPLPAALPLLGAGLAGLGAIGWVRRRREHAA